MKVNILLCTLGASWAVVPEIYGFVNSQQLPLYKNHSDAEQLEQLRNEYQLQPVDEIWVCTTQGEATEKSLIQLKRWIELLPNAPTLRIWQAQYTNELANQAECRHIQELILRATLLAHYHANGGQVVLSLAGGRKTMSADMQWAASIFGCQALLHVIGADYNNMPQALKNSAPELFLSPLSSQICSAVIPLVSGQTQRNDLLDICMDNIEAVTINNFPLPLSESGKISVWPVPDNWLQVEIKRREKTGSQLLGNYFLDLSLNECHENWRSLYRLSPRIIDTLRTTYLGPQHRTLLQTLPKADLHRHLGGCLGLQAQRDVGQAIWSSLNASQQTQALQKISHLLKRTETAWPEQWATQLKNDPQRSHLAAALLQHATDHQLQHNLWDVTEPRIGLKLGQPGFTHYERPGELSGSTVLNEPVAIPSYTRHLIQQMHDEGLAYVELRGSPQKYGNGMQFIERFHQAIQTQLTSLSTEERPLIRFIIIADRRNIQDLQATIELAVKAKQQWPDFVVGLDMAGDESQPLPKNMQDCFQPAFAQCLPITIHAGEGESADSIWTAAYSLHADRIGHGLTLNENPKLAERFRNRGICLELCPTSNMEVVGFHIPGQPGTQKYQQYPLLDLWKKGLPLTLCSDNPGISRTSLCNEYLWAAKMCSNQLTLWDTLAMIKQGFVHAFLDIGEKEKLLKRCDAYIYKIILDKAHQLS